MNAKERTLWMLVFGLIVCSLLLLLRLNDTPEPPPPCDASAAADEILRAERPNMGAIERKFWSDVLAKHYGGAGLSPVLGASLLATENRFKTYRVSSTGAQGAFQIQPNIWLGTPECPKNSDLFEVEVSAECSARILSKYVREGGSVEAGLRRYVAGPHGQANAQWYADQILARVARAGAKSCPQFKSYLVHDAAKN